jgi:single-stranded-DNA-specific exonuclease
MRSMQPGPSRWAAAPYDVAVAERLTKALGISRAVGAILARRGFRQLEEARSFLAADERHDPATLPGVPRACEIILDHLRRGARIAVFGDYDVDGVCSTAMLVRTLRTLGGDPLWELPSRFDEGYGLSSAAVERLASRGVELLVTVDCGITAVAEVAAGGAAGLEVIVTDHHRPGEALPDCTVVHPGLGHYACPELCATGVVLKLSEALYAAAGRDPNALEEELDLAALATVCDVVPLRGENRRIVRAGLAALARTRKPGLRALMAAADVEPGEVSEQALGFRLGPRLNAAGRLQHAGAALELLLTEDESRAEEVARELDLLNRDRQQAETRILFAAEAECATQASQAAIVVAGEGWHPGVVGIVAARLVERWRRPCLVVALEGGAGRGSGRSVPAYDLHAGLAACSEHLRRFGGHRAAAGVELDADSVGPLRRALASHAGAALAPADLIAVERVDAAVPGGALGLDLAEELEGLRPFGVGNPQPNLLVPASQVEGVAGMGAERQHARFTLVTAGGWRSRGVAFGSPPGLLTAAAGEPHDLVLNLERNRWNGVVEPRVRLRALCPTRSGRLHVLGEDEPFWTRLERELGELSGADREVPDGPDVANMRRPVDRRGDGVAAVAAELLTSGEAVLVGVADAPRRRRSLEALVAGLAPERLAVASWTTIAADPGVTTGSEHLLALDPPPGGMGDALLGGPCLAHLAWGPPEAEFALGVWRAELDLRPALTETFRALRALGDEAAPEALESALGGGSRYPRTVRCCARVIAVLTELGLIRFSAAQRSCRLLDAERTDLERSATYRRSRGRLAQIERALEPEVGPVSEASAA